MDQGASFASRSFLTAVAVVGVVLGPLLVGFEPVGGDPERMYRPIKGELARTLREGRLPFWTDRLGLGVPLVAESHVAAFYPPNWLFYGLLGVSTAYRWSMWLHHVLLAATTYMYARVLGLTGWGAALAGVAFALCGFQAIHSSHEPFYHALPYLPLALTLAERALADGKRLWVGLLALALGAQLTLGHFLIAYWTLGLVAATAAWRVVVDRAPARRGLAVLLAEGWGLAIGLAQLALSLELARFVGMADRPLTDLMYYFFPPYHWCEPILPGLFTGVEGGPQGAYWFARGSSGYEANLSVGRPTWILACVGLLAAIGDRRLRPLLIVTPLSFLLATAPGWYPYLYELWLWVPGAHLFRAPGRLTGLTSLGLALLAGAGFDRAVSRKRWRVGLGLALASLALAVAWAEFWCNLPVHRDAWPEGRLNLILAGAGVIWLIALASLLAWRAGRVGPLLPVVLVAAELGAHYYRSTTEWGWSIPLPSASPALARLDREPDGGRVAGFLNNLTLPAGMAPAHPYLGMVVPPPDRMLLAANQQIEAPNPVAARWLRRFGVRYGVWDVPVFAPGAEVLYEGPDPALDRLAIGQAPGKRNRIWRVLRDREAWPDVRVARREVVVGGPNQQIVVLNRENDPDLVTYLEADAPPDEAPRARQARIVSWDAARDSGLIEHDGTVELVLNRTYYPGWTARIDGGPPRPVGRVDLGVMAVRLEGPGPSRVELAYRPTDLDRVGPISIGATAAAVGAVGVCLIRSGRARRRPGR